MKITCLTESISQLGGGLFDAERRIQQSVMCGADDLQIDVLGIRDARSENDQHQWAPVKAKSIVTSKFPPGLGYSNGFQQHLSVHNPDVVYSIGLWKYFSKSCLNWHRKTGRPYVVAPHGMLDPWAIRNHRIRKNILMTIYQRSHLENAACIRALNLAELEAIRRLNLDNPVCLIPNGVDLPEQKVLENRIDNRPTILFLGRLHPKKGVEVLFDAWKQFTNENNGDHLLKVVGWGDEGYVAKLKEKVKSAGLENSVEMAGPLFGEQKRDAFLGAAGFILPSFSEGMPMTILEAWSYELPVIMTPHCNIPEGSANSACIECQADVESVFDALNQLARMSPAERTVMGRNGRCLVQDQFTWDAVSDKLKAVYRWLSKQSEQPECVVTQS